MNKIHPGRRKSCNAKRTITHDSLFGISLETKVENGGVSTRSRKSECLEFRTNFDSVQVNLSLDYSEYILTSIRRLFTRQLRAKIPSLREIQEMDTVMSNIIYRVHGCFFTRWRRIMRAFLLSPPSFHLQLKDLSRAKAPRREDGRVRRYLNHIIPMRFLLAGEVIGLMHNAGTNEERQAVVQKKMVGRARPPWFVMRDTCHVVNFPSFSHLRRGEFRLLAKYFREDGRRKKFPSGSRVSVSTCLKWTRKSAESTPPRSCPRRRTKSNSTNPQGG